MSVSELACTYASLILHDEGLEITEDKIATLLKEANVTIEPYWPSLFSRVLADKDITDLIMSGQGGAAGGAATSSTGGAPTSEGETEAASEPEPEPEEESDEDLGGGLFGDDDGW